MLMRNVDIPVPISQWCMVAHRALPSGGGSADYRSGGDSADDRSGGDSADDRSGGDSAETAEAEAIRPNDRSGNDSAETTQAGMIRHGLHVGIHM